ncbi:MAG: glucose-6-phosphate isomerase [Leptospiraceae bacterium]|nr:glucose-6-phosphate isomerase [Leptospiraceae bacterium]
MIKIKINQKFTKGFVNNSDLEDQLKKADSSRKLLHDKSGKGNDFLGWVELPSQVSDDDLAKIESVAKKIQSNSEYLVVVGIGGSYLGARAVIEASINSFEVYSKKSNGVKILYAGHQIDPDYQNELIEFLQDKDFSINVISKSGTTTEPALAFRSLLTLAEKKFGKENLKDRVFSTTDEKKGALKKLSDEMGFTTFVIPDDVGGRYSVLTPVGLLPIAAAGIDIKELIKGAKEMQANLASSSGKENLSCYYAALRNSLYNSGKKIEIMVNYNPKLHFFIEWWKQLYGESEGKEKKGIFPAGVDFTTDLHSMGQYIQDGERILFETVINIGSPKKDFTISEFPGDPDGLNYLAGKTLSFVTSKAIEGTKLAHLEGGVPGIEIQLEDTKPDTLGQMIYFFEYGCGVSGYMLGVNPFDQPGVEDYKNNMFALLGKKGYETKKSEVEKKLSEL